MPQNNTYKKNLRINATSAIILQIVTALIGLIVPRIMIREYGSEINGLISSITQFLGYISLLEAGVGGVLKASLYVPVVENDAIKISRVMNSGAAFFKKIARIFLLYICFLALIYPIMIENDIFSREYILMMIVILGAETFIRYYFSLTYQILLQASQRIYFINYLQTVLIIINAVSTAILANLRFEIHIVKFVTMLVFLVRPIFIILYTNRIFKISRDAGCDDSAMSQRWAGFGQHIGYFIHKNTDIAVLTMFSPLSEISVYGVYHAVVTAIQTISLAFSNSISATLGTLYAEKDEKKLEKVFSQYEAFIFLGATLLFSVTCAMIVPFISVYTKGVNDVSYVRPLFGIVIVLSEFLYVIRSPYSCMALSAGFYRQTRNGAFVEAGINLTLSLLLVHKFGITGIAFATLLAMGYRTFEFVRFSKNNILKRNYRYFLKYFLISIASIFLVYIIAEKLILPFFTITGWIEWMVAASAVTVSSLIAIIVVNLILNREGLLNAIKLFAKEY